MATMETILPPTSQARPRPHRPIHRWAFVCIALLSIAAVQDWAQAEVFQAQDTAFAAPPHAEVFEALLTVVAWEPGPFTVRVEDLAEASQPVPTRLIRFASPRPSGDPLLDTASIRWFVAAPQPDEPDEPDRRPAVVLAHSLHAEMLLADALARTIASLGVHAFVVEMPGYGHRRDPDGEWPGIVSFRHGVQGIADLRRAYDAVAVLPTVDPQRVMLQGTSMGSFAAAVASGLQPKYTALVMFLGGANVDQVLDHGQHDARYFRESLDRAGLDAARRAELLFAVEPLRVVSRLDPQTTWIIAAKADQVVAAKHAQTFADALALPEDHRVWLNGNHYTAVIAMPAIAQELAKLAGSPKPREFDWQAGP